MEEEKHSWRETTPLLAEPAVNRAESHWSNSFQTHPGRLPVLGWGMLVPAQVFNDIPGSYVSVRRNEPEGKMDKDKSRWFTEKEVRVTYYHE